MTSSLDSYSKCHCFIHSYIEGTIPKNLGNLAQLKELFLDDNELTGSIPSDLGGLANVDYLALASNNLGRWQLKDIFYSLLR